MKALTSASACCSAASLADGTAVAVQNAVAPVASSRRTNRTRSPPGDHCGLTYACCGAPKLVGLLPSRLINSRLDVEPLLPGEVLAISNEAASGAQFKSDHV